MFSQERSFNVLPSAAFTFDSTNTFSAEEGLGIREDTFSHGHDKKIHIKPLAHS
jgi:hypothetical protein